MKSIKIFAVALTLAATSFGSFAADQVNTQPSNSNVAGVVSAQGAYDLSSLEAQLAAKADAAGAKAFRIVSTTGQNQMHGVAEIYN